ncbi:MAG: DUF4169 domain-containing protein [Alphaproteobacteria bacterium]|nr:DUF4169 domain-containing protein [Alphaproteobacteria bacterium]MCY4318597.1 DUF4169 domain-containing protein [Alphaproteobacteria bacterium]
MADIINLNKARKAADRARRKDKAKERRAPQNGSRPDARRRERALDGKRLDPPPDSV